MMIRVATLILVMASGHAFSAAPLSKAPVKFDTVLAIDLAKAYLQAYFRAHPKTEPSGINWNDPVVVGSRIQGGRELVYVGFKPLAGKVGAYMVLEKCDPLVPNHYGAEEDVGRSAASYRAIHGTDEAGPYTACAAPFE